MEQKKKSIYVKQLQKRRKIKEYVQCFFEALGILAILEILRILYIVLYYIIKYWNY